tara:strand:+ start:207 stop:350 length:144 start_codon:yes stop_codon:yes gene_type:complete
MAFNKLPDAGLDLELETLRNPLIISLDIVFSTTFGKFSPKALAGCFY